MSNVITLKHSDTTVNFTNQQVRRTLIRTDQDAIVKRLQNRQPVLYYIGPEWKEIDVSLIHQKREVLTNINTVRAWTGYIRMQIFKPNGTELHDLYVKVDPNVTIHYYGGGLDYNQDVVLRFYESTSGEAAPQIEKTLTVQGVI